PSGRNAPGAGGRDGRPPGGERIRHVAQPRSKGAGTLERQKPADGSDAGSVTQERLWILRELPIATEFLTRCRDFRNVWKKHGPSPLIPLPAPFTFPLQQRGERVGRGAMLIPPCQELCANCQLAIGNPQLFPAMSRTFDPAVWAAVPFHFWSLAFFVFCCAVGSF